MLIKVRNIKPGDILVFDRDPYGKKVAPKNTIVCAVVLSASKPDEYKVTQYSIFNGMLSDFVRGGDVEFEVERAALTPAQQHADDLIICGRQIVDAHTPEGATDLPIGTPASVRWMRNILREIDPPQPPTAQELAATLAKLANDSILPPLPAYATRLLDRARQAGML